MSLLLFALAYLIGSIPFGYLFVRAARKVDVRDYGSHNVGAINVFRVGGVWLGTATLLADAAKGAGIVLLAAALQVPAGTIATAAFLTLFGHAYSLYFYLRERRFSEGKSVAGGVGVLCGLTWIGALPAWVVALTLAIWAGGLLLPRLLTGRWACISPATMAATVAVPCLTWAAHPLPAYRALTLAMAVLVLVRHKNNLRRLWAGTEPRLGDRIPSSPAP